MRKATVKEIAAIQKVQVATIRAQEIEARLTKAEIQLNEAAKNTQQMKKDLQVEQENLVAAKQDAQRAKKEQLKVVWANRLEQSGSGLLRSIPQNIAAIKTEFGIEKFMIEAIELGQESEDLLKQGAAVNSNSFSLKAYPFLRSPILALRTAVNLPLVGNLLLDDDKKQLKHITFSDDSKALIIGPTEDDGNKLTEVSPASQIEAEQNPKRIEAGKMYSRYNFSLQFIPFNGNFLGFSSFANKPAFFTKSNNLLLAYTISGELLQKLKFISYDIGDTTFKGYEYLLVKFSSKVRNSDEDSNSYPLVGSWLSYDTGQIWDLKNGLVVIPSGGEVSFNLERHSLDANCPETNVCLFSVPVTQRGFSRNSGLSIRDSSDKILYELNGSFIDFEPVKKYFLVSDQGTSKLYDSSGHVLTEFKGDQAVFVPNKERLLVSSKGITRLYDFSGDLLAEFFGNYFLMSPDGSYLITSLSNGQKRLWSMNDGLDDLLTKGCTWLKPYLKFHPEDLKRLKVCQINNARATGKFEPGDHPRTQPEKGG